MDYKVELQLSNNCNRNCFWCHAFNGGDCDHKNMSLESLNKIIEILKTEEKRYIFCLSRYCEPLLSPDVLYEFSKLLKDNFKDCFISIHTNGDFLNTQILDKFQFVDQVVINSYNTVSDEDGFNKLMDIFGFSIYSSARKVNEDKDKILFEYNSTKFQLVLNKKDFLKDNMKSRAGSLFKVKENELRNDHCDVVNKMMAIDYNGDIYPCCEVTGLVREQKEYKMCNIKDLDNLNDFNELVEKFNYKNHAGCKHCSAYSSQVIPKR